jgi:predicted metal-dependent peptidase
MTHLEKIQKAKARLMLDHPYFGTIASALKLEQNNELLTFLSDGEALRYNSEYIDRLDVAEVEFVMANGAMHAVLKHQHRSAGRTKWLWQTATDYVVNSMLVNNGMQLPEYANYEHKFDGMYAEEVYQMLRDEMMNDEFGMEEQIEQIMEGDDVHNENIHMQQENVASPDASEQKYDKNSKDKEESSSTPSQNSEELAEELKEQFEQIFQKLNRQGTLPKDLKFVVPEYFSHKVDWRELLYGYIASYAKSTYSFVPPNMKYLYRGIYLPSLSSESTYSFIPPNMKYLYRGIYLPSLSSDLLRIVIAIDTSGSVDETLLSTFLGEVNSIMQSYPNYEIDLITADAKIQSHKVFLPGESLDYEASGGGGTDFRPVFEYVDQQINYPTLLLYFTDGLGTFPEMEPAYDVMWIMPEKVDVPFGEIMVLEKSLEN